MKKDVPSGIEQKAQFSNSIKQLRQLLKKLIGIVGDYAQYLADFISAKIERIRMRIQKKQTERFIRTARKNKIQRCWVIGV